LANTKTIVSVWRVFDAAGKVCEPLPPAANRIPAGSDETKIQIDFVPRYIAILSCRASFSVMRVKPKTLIAPTIQRVGRGKMEIDLHGYHPAEIVFNGVLGKILQQTWEMGEIELTLIHGHGRNRGITPGFVNTNTGYFGLCIRRALRDDRSFRQWIKHTTLDCRQMGSTSIRLKPNSNPTRKQLDCV
jgi:hypothetical protein